MYILTKNEKIENISCVRFGDDIAQLISKDGNSTTIRKNIILTIADDTEDITTILDRVTNNYKNSTDLGIDWYEINLIIQKKSSKGSYMVKPEEMTKENYTKISFLIAEVNSFTDSQETVTESGAIFRRHLSEKYCNLSTESINRLVDRFCFINR